MWRHVPDEAGAWALTEGRHGEPSLCLGPHGEGLDRTVVAIDPGAEAMWALADGQPHPLPRIGGAVFGGPVPGHGAYTLRGQGLGGQWEHDDAHRFGPVLGDVDLYLIGEGTHQRLWDALGAHVMAHEGVEGTHFAVWAPNARAVAVVGEFNAWDGRRHPMRRRGGGVWEIFVPGIGDGAAYKYAITGPYGETLPLKADPLGFGSEHPPANASRVRDLRGHAWSDGDWMARREAAQRRDAPISIYEVHLGSWRRRSDEGGRPLTYRELARDLVPYVRDLGFTHIELMPVSEFPFDGSWGYQPVGLYAPTCRFGTPEDFRHFVEAVHAAGLGLLLDWVPGHFPTDPHGLGRFDGTALYEHADPREGFHQDWNTLIFNYGRTEVANYLIANAIYWLTEHHIDGLRVDAVASMLYRDYSRQPGEWVPNVHGGRENLEAIGFMQRANVAAYGAAPGAMVVAEESTAFPGVTTPVHHGGLGFGYKWNMGWMNDSLRYMHLDPIHRRFHHNDMTGGLNWAFTENFVLPISHDEVVHGKGSMLEKMPGDAWEKRANLRAFYGFMWGYPGKKLLFMGCEFGQGHEWRHGQDLDWAAADTPEHGGIRRLVADLNAAYRDHPALHVRDCEPAGFRWIDWQDGERSILPWLRFGRDGDAPVAVLCNMTPIDRRVRLGLPRAGRWAEVVNTDAEIYGGAGRGNMGAVTADDTAWNDLPASAEITLPGLTTLILVHQPD